MKNGLSLVGIKSLGELQHYLGEYPEISFELSYNLDEEVLSSWLPHLEGRVASIHSLCPRRAFFPNLASSGENLETSRKEILKDGELAKRVGASVLVLHPGYVVPGLVPTDVKERLRLLSAAIPSDMILRERGSICTLDYPRRKEYRKAFDTMVGNVSALSLELAGEGVVLALENLNPRAGYLVVDPNEMVELASVPDLHLALDIGHLWVSCCLFGCDFLTELERILSTGKVVTSHIHSNSSRLGDVDSLEDQHLGVGEDDLPFLVAVERLREAGIPMMVESLSDIEPTLRKIL